MTAAWLLPRGDTLTATLDVAADISGWTPRWTLKAASGWADALDAAATSSATVGTGLTVTDAVAGTIDLSIAASVTALWAPGVYVWDLQLVNGTEVRTVEWDAQGTSHGTLAVSPDVSRTTP